MDGVGVEVDWNEMEGIVKLAGMRAGSLPLEEIGLDESLLVRQPGVIRLLSVGRLVNVLFRETRGEAVMVWIDEVSDGFRALVGVMSFFELGVVLGLYACVGIGRNEKGFFIAPGPARVTLTGMVHPNCDVEELGSTIPMG